MERERVADSGQSKNFLRLDTRMQTRTFIRRKISSLKRFNFKRSNDISFRFYNGKINSQSILLERETDQTTFELRNSFHVCT